MASSGASMRSAPYRLRAPPAVKANIARVIGDPTTGVPGLTMYLLANPAPTTYMVKEASSEEVRKVVIGQRMQCSCGGGGGGGGAVDEASEEAPQASDGGLAGNNGSVFSSGNSAVRGRAIGEAVDVPELCVHVLWVLLKALKAPSTHPSVWQLSLLDTEFDTLLSFREHAQKTAEKKRHRFLRRGVGRGGGLGNSGTDGDAETSPADDSDGNQAGNTEGGQ